MPKIKKVSKKKVVDVPQGGFPSDVSDAIEPVVEKYRFEVMVNDTHFKTTANSLAEGIDAFIKSPEFPAAIKTKVILRFGKGNEMTQKLWPTATARRIFATMEVKPALSEFLGEQLTRRL